MTHFELQPDEKLLQELADQAWAKASYREHELEKLAFEAGASIRNGDHSLANLEAIVRWKSDRLVEYLTGNSKERAASYMKKAVQPSACASERARDQYHTPSCPFRLPCRTESPASFHAPASCARNPTVSASRSATSGPTTRARSGCC